MVRILIYIFLDIVQYFVWEKNLSDFNCTLFVCSSHLIKITNRMSSVRFVSDWNMKSVSHGNY